MPKHILIALTASLPLLSSELPPMIPVGPVSYASVTHQPTTLPITDTNGSAYTPTPNYTDTPDPLYNNAPAIAPAATGPITPPASAGHNGSLILNAYTTNYQVRGMGVTDHMSNHGYTSLTGSYILPNRNLFNLGIQQRISGTYGCIWDAGEALGDAPLFNINYALGKEIFPNLILEAGYSLHYGGLEGYMSRFYNGAAHRFSQDLNLTLTFNDRQKGFFGGLAWGIGFQGLTGTYYDIEAGYRLTDIISTGNIGADLELSTGLSASLGYWGGGIEGTDAWRIKAALPLYTHTGSIGRDARIQIAPWIQLSWAGSNARKFDRRTGHGPIDHSQVTIGINLGWNF